MRPTVTTKHRELSEKIAADVEAFLSRGGKQTESDEAISVISNYLAQIVGE